MRGATPWMRAGVPPGLSAVRRTTARQRDSSPRSTWRRQLVLCLNDLQPRVARWRADADLPVGSASGTPLTIASASAARLATGRSALPSQTIGVRWICAGSPRSPPARRPRAHRAPHPTLPASGSPSAQRRARRTAAAAHAVDLVRTLARRSAYWRIAHRKLGASPPRPHPNSELSAAAATSRRRDARISAHEVVGDDAASGVDRRPHAAPLSAPRAPRRCARVRRHRRVDAARVADAGPIISSHRSWRAAAIPRRCGIASERSVPRRGESARYEAGP